MRMLPACAFGASGGRAHSTIRTFKQTTSMVYYRGVCRGTLFLAMLMAVVSSVMLVSAVATTLDAVHDAAHSTANVPARFNHIDIYESICRHLNQTDFEVFMEAAGAVLDERSAASLRLGYYFRNGELAGHNNPIDALLNLEMETPNQLSFKILPKIVNAIVLVQGPGGINLDTLFERAFTVNNVVLIESMLRLRQSYPASIEQMVKLNFSRSDIVLKASSEGCLETVRLILNDEFGYSPKTWDHQHQQLLGYRRDVGDDEVEVWVHAASKNGHLQLVQFFIETGLFNPEARYPEQSFVVVCMDAKANVLRWLFEKYNLKFDHPGMFVYNDGDEVAFPHWVRVRRFDRIAKEQVFQLVAKSGDLEQAKWFAQQSFTEIIEGYTSGYWKRPSSPLSMLAECQILLLEEAAKLSIWNEGGRIMDMFAEFISRRLFTSVAAISESPPSAATSTTTSSKHDAHEIGASWEPFFLEHLSGPNAFNKLYETFISQNRWKRNLSIVHWLIDSGLLAKWLEHQFYSNGSAHRDICKMAGKDGHRLLNHRSFSEWAMQSYKGLGMLKDPCPEEDRFNVDDEDEWQHIVANDEHVSDESDEYVAGGDVVNN